MMSSLNGDQYIHF